MTSSNNRSNSRRSSSQRRPQLPQTSHTDAMIAQLRQLGDLHTSGVLDDAEFDVEKHKILNS